MIFSHGQRLEWRRFIARGEKAQIDGVSVSFDAA